MNNTYILLIFLFIGNICFGQKSKVDTVKVSVFASDTTDYMPRPVICIDVLEVREWHNTAEGATDPGACMGCKWFDYYIHIKYLTFEKKEFPNKYLIFKPKQDD